MIFFQYKTFIYFFVVQDSGYYFSSKFHIWFVILRRNCVSYWYVETTYVLFFYIVLFVLEQCAAIKFKIVSVAFEF